MEEDLEIQAITGIAALLVPLSDEGRARVIDYVLKRFGSHAQVKSLPEAAEAPGADSMHVDKPAGRKQPGRRKPSKQRPAAATATEPEEKVDITRLVNAFKNRNDYAKIDEEVLGHNSLVTRVVFALAMYREVYGDEAGLTSGDIRKFYKQLGVAIALPSVSTTLSGKAKQFVLTEGLRFQGSVVRYRLSRHGVIQARELGFIADE
jgi:hypothetical protein